MPDGTESEQGVLNKSRSQDSREGHKKSAGPSRRASSDISTRSRCRSPRPSQGSKTPLTPAESPPFRTTRKQTAGTVEVEDKELDSASATPVHSRGSSGDSTVHVCICQPDPKIPRPRNAFILYRQHHQAQVVAQNPGLANPEISKIIGEQWQNQSTEVKNKWKGLAEEEKVRHQQQYPTYRYQPKRNDRRGSLSSDANGTGEKPKCPKCGGRSILVPSTPFANQQSNGASPASVPPTPGSAITPVSRTLPVFKDLSPRSPAARRMGKVFQSSKMSPNHCGYADERDDIGPLTPDMKRRKYNGEYGPPVSRAMPPRYAVPPPGAPIGPGTLFPFGQTPPPHPYPPVLAHARRESLPGIRGVVSPPGPMPPPPRPGMGYQQHRMSQGHIGLDRSLQLPPLQTGSLSGSSGAAAIAGSGKTVEEQIMAMPFRYKVKVLSQVAPPAPMDTSPRGLLIAIEGDSAEAVAELSKWLFEELRKGSDLAVTLFDSPDLSPNGQKRKPMVQYHLLATEWLSRSDEIVDTISYKPVATPVDSAMADASPTKEPAQSTRDIDEKYDDSDSPGRQKSDQSNDPQKAKSQPLMSETESMNVDKTPTTAKPSTSSTTFPTGGLKPVGMIPNYSLHASNVFACRIPIRPHDSYSPSDHWQWTATQWRGVVGPDLTIFLRDAVVGETGKATVEILEEGNLFVVKRTDTECDKGLELDASTLRRLGFEVGEWVRAFGTQKRGSA